MANTGSKKARKVKNLGVVYFDGSKNSWVGLIEIGKYSNGRTKYKCCYGSSQNTVIDKMRDYCSNHPYCFEKQEDVNSITVTDYFTNFLQCVKKPKLKPASFTRELGTLNNHIIPYIGTYNLAELTTLIIQTELVNALMVKGLSYSSVHKAYILVNEGLRYAYKQSLIPNNPCDLVEEPSKKVFTNNKSIRFLDDNEISNFISAATTKTKSNKKMKYRNGYAIISLIYTGLRGGELMALKWGDINFEGGYISVRRNVAAVYNSEGKREVLIQDGTKTKEGRTVYLSKSAKKYLQLAKLTQSASQTQNDNFVYITNGCRDLSSLEETYSTICDKAGISNHQGIHTLRHTCASLLIRKGVDVKIISEMLGHSSVSFTYNTYIHLLEEEKAKVIGELDI
ncbi:MAG: tyrosine-type recombinase/integrase [Oscillospiraceae bacterium]